MAGDSASETTEVLEKLGEVSQILTEVMLYDPTTFQSGSEKPVEKLVEKPVEEPGETSEDVLPPPPSEA